MSIKLYYAPGACSFVPHTLLEASGEPFEPVLVKLHKGENYGDEFKAVNPRSQVPVLVDGNETITQITAIVQYLDARLPQKNFLPRELVPRTRVLETLAWMNNTVHPAFTHVFMPHKFAGTPEAQAEMKAFNTGLYRGMLGELEAMAASAAGQVSTSARWTPTRSRCCAGAVSRRSTPPGSLRCGRMCSASPHCHTSRARSNASGCS